MGELQQGRIAIRPYNVRKHTHTMPMMFFVYLHICERPENTRVGAKSARAEQVSDSPNPIPPNATQTITILVVVNL